MSGVNIPASMKELQNLKQEETTLVNMSSKISDQLNRLKVEELALQNMVRLQNEELERKSRGSQRSINRSLPMDESEKGDNSEKVVPVDLFVNMRYGHEEEEEEEEEEEDEMKEVTNEDIDAFVDGLG